MTIVAHPTAKISDKADIEDSLRGSLIAIGENCVIDSFVKIKPAGGIGNLVIGDNTTINSGCVLYTGHGIRIGKGVLIAANCTFAATNHAYELKDVPIREQGFTVSKGGIVVEDDVWIGANCVILDGAVIMKGAVVGAGTIVRGTLESYGVYAGTPLRKIAERR